MLSTLLSQLQSYFSKYFVLGSFCPILAFTFVNGATAYLLWAKWRVWVDDKIADSSAGHAVFVITSTTVAMILLAYVLSSLNTFLRRLLEGQWWEPLAKLFIPTQNARRTQLREKLKAAIADRADLKQAAEWKSKLRKARVAGITDHPDVEFKPAETDLIEKELKRFEELVKKNEVVPANDLEQTVTDLEDRLTKNNANKGSALDLEHTRLVTLIGYAEERAKASYTQLLNNLHTSFGAEEEVAATKMGNIANTTQGYALRRYRCNLETVWSNLQRVVQRDEKAQAALQESKTQLDFLVACCWLTLLWSVIWTIVFASVVPSRVGFLMAALVGPAIAYAWYRAAAEQYRSFADVMMTTLDTFRFALLEEMRIRVPDDVEDERNLWESIDNLTTYEEKINFRYVKPSPGSQL